MLVKPDAPKANLAQFNIKWLDSVLFLNAYTQTVFLFSTSSNLQKHIHNVQKKTIVTVKLNSLT